MQRVRVSAGYARSFCFSSPAGVEVQNIVRNYQSKGTGRIPGPVNFGLGPA